MTKDEALKLALEALLSCSAGDYSTGHVIHPSFDVDAVNKAIEAIDALAEQPAQQQEPVWIQPNHLQKARQTPFLCRVEPKHRDDFVPLYTTPPHRKPLTDEEIKRMAAKWFLSMYWPLCNTFARAIEAAHGIRSER